MNRIPNYRVWHKIEKRFVDLRNIDFEQESIGYDCYREANYYDVAKFDEIVFQQFTGLYDKNKKPIYEGDRVRFGYTKNEDFFGEVIWLEDRASFGVRTGNAFETFEDLMDYMKYFEVVGNIFQLPCNPDHNGECLVCDCWLCDCPFNKKEQQNYEKL
jgi:uncharacterized phage protein (TIGR01671 family)